jgi:hypothetical protein
MARNKFALCCALRHVFFNDFALDRVFIMNDLASLFIYYADNDVLPQLSADFNKLNVWLTKVELIKKPRKDEPYKIPTDFRCDLNTDDATIPMFKFAPEIHMPEVRSYSIPPAILQELTDELSTIDVASLAAYVRAKAMAAGDLALTSIEGDDQTW